MSSIKNLLVLSDFLCDDGIEVLDVDAAFSVFVGANEIPISKANQDVFYGVKMGL